jgi:hypothetical protein
MSKLKEITKLHGNVFFQCKISPKCGEKGKKKGNIYFVAIFLFFWRNCQKKNLIELLFLFFLFLAWFGLYF